MSKGLNKSISLMLVLAMLLLMLPGCSQKTDSGTSDILVDRSNGSDKQADTKPLTVVLAQPSDPPTLDPHRASADLGPNVFRNICETLTSFDGENNLIPLLAESWENPTENEWIFHLKQGVEFSNGEEFTAEAVGWNLDRGASTEFPRQGFTYRNYYEIGGWEAVDKYTIKITTALADCFFPEHMADIAMIAPEYSKSIGEDAISGDPVGTGPYVLESWKHDQEVVLKINENYYGPRPDIDTYIVRTIPEAATRVAELVNGNVDIIYDVNYEYIDMIRAQSNITIENKTTRRNEYIGFNTTDWSPNPQLQDKRVRQALNYAVNKESILENVMGGMGEISASIYRSDFPFYDSSIEGFEYNPQKARELLTEAGYGDGFQITLMTNSGNHAKALEVCQAVATDLKAVGIDCQVESYENSAARSMLINGQSQKLAPGLFDWNWASKPTIMDSYLTGIIRSDGMTSYNCIAGYDELVDKIINTTDLEGKEPYCKELQRKLIEDPPFLYLFQLGSVYAVSDKVSWSPAKTQYILALEMEANN